MILVSDTNPAQALAVAHSLFRGFERRLPRWAVVLERTLQIRNNIPKMQPGEFQQRHMQVLTLQNT